MPLLDCGAPKIIDRDFGYPKRCLCKEVLCPLPVLGGVVIFSTSLTDLSRKIMDDSDWLSRYEGEFQKTCRDGAFFLSR